MRHRDASPSILEAWLNLSSPFPHTPSPVLRARYTNHTCRPGSMKLKRCTQSVGGNVPTTATCAALAALFILSAAGYSEGVVNPEANTRRAEAAGSMAPPDLVRRKRRYTNHGSYGACFGGCNEVRRLPFTLPAAPRHNFDQSAAHAEE